MLKFFNGNAKYFLPVFFLLAVFLIFQKNALGTVKKNFFRSLQTDSESLVVAGVVADQRALYTGGWWLGTLSLTDPQSSASSTADPYRLLSEQESLPESAFLPYRSQAGAQGFFYSMLQAVFGFDKVSKLQYFPSAVLSILVVAFFYLHRKIYGLRYAVLFTVAMVFSPWIASFAKNLYWSPFLWFLPLFFSTLAYLTASNAARWFLYFLVFISFFIKSLCGYEYITSITLLACSPFILAPLFSGEGPAIKRALMVFVLCVLGFAFAFAVHANMRGKTIVEGAVEIYQQDVKRRTYSDPSDFDPVYKESLRASPFSVVKTYVITWNSPLITGVSGKVFKVLIIFAIIGLFLKKKIGHQTFMRDLVLLLYMFAIPVSWFVLAKAHSYIHVHMNYVLWYLGFVPALFFVCGNSIVVMCKVVPKYIDSLELERF